MSKPRVYQYPNCSTCKKALKWLSARGVAIDSRNIVETPPSLTELKQALKLSGLPIKKLFNTSGASYRDGGFGERLPEMSEKAALAALAADGKLIKRPLVLMGDTALVGFDEGAYQAAFAGKK
jgi:arsenate reductase